MAEGEDLLSKPLKISDLDVVLEKLLEAQNSSYQIGLKFKLDVHALDAIHVRETVSQRCLMRVLREILNQEPPPTWKLFIEALRSPLINLPRLAKQLEKDLLHKTYTPAIETKKGNSQQKPVVLLSRDGAEGIPLIETAVNIQELSLEENRPWNMIKLQREQIEAMKKVERELRQSNELLRQQIEHMEKIQQEYSNVAIDRDLLLNVCQSQSETARQNYVLQANLHAMELELNQLRQQLQLTTDQMQLELHERDKTIQDLHTTLQTTEEEVKAQNNTSQNMLEEKNRAKGSHEVNLHQISEEMQKQLELEKRNQYISNLESELHATKKAMKFEKACFEVNHQQREILEVMLQQIKKERENQETTFNSLGPRTTIVVYTFVVTRNSNVPRVNANVYFL